MRELRTTEKLIITVATTGTFQGKEAHPRHPEQPEEIAQAAYESWNEGASVVHIHARDKDGKPTSDPDVFREIDRKIREKNCDIIIQHSTAGDYIPRLPADKRLRAIEMNPEMASLDITVSRLVTFGGKENFWVVTMPEIEHGAKLMLEKNIKPELEIFNPVCIEDVYKLIDAGLLTKPYYFGLVLGMRRINRSYMGYSPKLFLQLVDMLPPDSLFNGMGIGSDELPAAMQAILLGGNLRVGFEDNIYYTRGRLAENNAQLVARAARLARELGGEVVGPSEARKMLGIRPLEM
jgi:3-keto-5-aminohexanoate cleavage enzyme